MTEQTISYAKCQSAATSSCKHNFVHSEEVISRSVSVETWNSNANNTNEENILNNAILNYIDLNQFRIS